MFLLYSRLMFSFSKKIVISKANISIKQKLDAYTEANFFLLSNVHLLKQCPLHF
jgi:hypothetical protein